MDKKNSKRHVSNFFYFLLSSRVLKRIAIFIFVFLLNIFVLVFNFLPQEDLTVGQRSPRDIKSPRFAKYKDIEETERRIREKIENAPKYYQKDPTVILGIESEIEDIFSKIENISSLEEWSTRKKIEYLKNNLKIKCSSQVLNYLLELDVQTLRQLQKVIMSILKEVMSGNIRSDVPLDIEEAKKSIREKVEKLNFKETHSLIILEIASLLVRPNNIYDEDQTQRQKEEIRRKVKPVIKFISAGETIVYKDKIITPQDMVKLSAAGLISPKISLSIILYLVILNLAIFFVFIYFVKHFFEDIFYNEKKLFLIGIVYSLGLVFSKFLSNVSTGYLSCLPVISVSQILTIFINPIISLIISVVLSIHTGIILQGELKFVILGILSCIAGIVGVHRLYHREDIVKAGLFVLLVQVFCILSFSLISEETIVSTLKNMGIGLINGIGSSILTIGGLYFLEKPFGTSTPFKLLELTSAENPLIKRLMVEAPGTYNHSVYTGNLAENAASEIGANPLLARVGSLYHDIGKLKRPYFFVENQINMENLHEKISPNLSASIIKAHVSDGVEIAKQYKLLPEIINIIAEHHGTSLISYFYHQASSDNENISEEHFRYDGKKPQTKEAALVMLADSVEAAARTLSSYDSERIQMLVKSIVKGKLEDGQLDESEITFRDINKIVETFCRILDGMFHSRVEYPEIVQNQNAE